MSETFGHGKNRYFFKENCCGFLQIHSIIRFIILLLGKMHVEFVLYHILTLSGKCEQFIRFVTLVDPKQCAKPISRF